MMLIVELEALNGFPLVGGDFIFHFHFGLFNVFLYLMSSNLYFHVLERAR